jgi:hypothetical protein
VALWFAVLTAVSIHASALYALLIASSLLFFTRARARVRAAFAAATPSAKERFAIGGHGEGIY